MDERAASLGEYLKNRRAKIDAGALGFSTKRRRTPGLRREEVAHRASISPTWYTCLEQGRGGAPSADVLNRLARALLLTDVEREHLFFLGLGRAPQISKPTESGVPSNLQSVLDALGSCPAFIRTSLWDVVAWNDAATKFLDFAHMEQAERNLLKIAFLDLKFREMQEDWESVAAALVGIFRRDAARAGIGTQANLLAEEISRRSSEFAALWLENDVCGYEPGLKRIELEGFGRIAYEYTVFAVDGRSDLNMVVFCPIESSL